MDLFYSVLSNLSSPPILFFLLGITAGFVKSDLEVPKSISRYLSIYLMMAIGFKGGVAVVTPGALGWELVTLTSAGLLIGFLLPALAYALLRVTTALDQPTAAAVAAHYGSISVVTFAAGCDFLQVHSVAYMGYIVALVALMEAPAILSGLFIAHRVAPQTRQHQQEEKKLLAHEIFTNGAILLLLGSFLIGVISGPQALEKLEGFLVSPFEGVLCLFLLDMGLVVAKNLHELRNFTWQLVLFGLYMPLIGGAIGLFASQAMGLDVGTGTLFIILCGSASYIAVPAAMRLALPEAKAAIYLPLSIGITFPFSIGIGIPLAYTAATLVLS
ncbi:MAG: sodium-dependent bicarbonate transport family permease [Verrucomicrobia bacterium]|nr:sodium-dependent bicarbonate transport family permease [Verrucomicrobiota bacterium]